MSTRVRNLVIAMIMGMLLALGTTAFGQIADDYEYYKIITDNNLFRPLGWKPPVRKLPYYLIGTKVEEGGTAWAYMSRNPEGLVTSVVRVGIDIAGSRVKSIERYKVEMENGDVYTMPRVGFLQTSKSSRNSRRRGSTDSGASGVTQGSETTTRNQSSVNGSTRRSRGGQQGSATAAQRERWQGQVERFQNATAEERLDMIEQFRQRGGRRGRRQGGN